ncbi:MAG: hypothetical protein ABIR70_18390 [Bryobacteraceae bacterium]
MSSPLHLVPGWAPELARRRFSFSPAIVGTTHNEWTLHRVGSDEAIVVNTASQEEFSIPRRFIGDVSRLEEPVRVVTLLRRLEYSDGLVRPVNRAVITMPVASDAPRMRAALPATVVAIREEVEPTPRWKHYLRISVALGCLACFIAVYVFREGRSARVRRFSARPSRLVPHPPASIPQVQQERR